MLFSSDIFKFNLLQICIKTTESFISNRRVFFVPIFYLETLNRLIYKQNQTLGAWIKKVQYFVVIGKTKKMCKKKETVWEKVRQKNKSTMESITDCEFAYNCISQVAILCTKLLYVKKNDKENQQPVMLLLRSSQICVRMLESALNIMHFHLLSPSYDDHTKSTKKKTQQIK